MSNPTHPTQEAIAQLQAEIAFYQRQSDQLRIELSTPQPAPAPLQGDAQTVVTQVLSRQLQDAKVAPSRDARREAIAHFQGLIDERQGQLVQLLDQLEDERLAAIIAEGEARLSAAQAKLEAIYPELREIVKEVGEVGAYNSPYSLAYRERCAKQNRPLTQQGKYVQVPDFLTGVPHYSMPWLRRQGEQFYFEGKNLSGR
jgi:hypothetical protein